MGFFQNIIKREVSKQFLRFCGVGILITIFAYIVFFVLFYFFSINYLISAAISFISGVIAGFALNKVYTFRSKRRNLVTIPQYFLVYGISFTFAMFSIAFLVESLDLNPIISNLIVQPIIVFMNFLSTKIIVFRNKQW